MWQIILTIREPDEQIARVLERYLRAEWLGPDNPDLPEAVTVTVQEVAPGPET